MGFNFGAFAGGLAQGGLNTYQQLSAIQSQKKRDELIDLQAQEMKAAGEERAALKEAAGVYNKVGGQDYAPELQRTAGIGADQAGRLALNTGAGNEEFDRAVNQSAAAALLENKARADASRAGIPTDDAATWQKAQADAAGMKPSAYTREQADTEYLAKVRGINPEKALTVENQQTQTALGKSSLKRVKAEDDFSEWMQGAQEQAAKDPVGFLKANLGAYNNAKKGSHLDDGNTASVVASADGKSFSFVRTDAKGKVVDSTLITPTSAGEALKHIAFSKYSSLPGKFKDAEELGLRKTEVGFKGREVAVKEARLPYENMKDAGVASYYAGGKGSAGGSAAGKATIAQQMVDDGIAPDVAAAYRIMASKDARSSVEQDWAKTRLEIVKANPGATAAELSKAKESFFAENGVAPQALADALTSGINPQTGKPFDPATADKLIADFNKKYPASKVDKADLTWVKKPDSAIPKNKDKAEPKEEPKAEAKPKTALPWQEKQKAEAARMKAEREARDIEEARKKREQEAETAARNKAILNAPLQNRGG